jgi:putative pyoverdin transport system ATP-binding/permease protein
VFCLATPALSSKSKLQPAKRNGRNIVAFFFQYSPGIMLASILAGAVSGASSAALLGVINSVLRANGSPGRALIGGFLGLCVLLPATRYVSELLLSKLGQDALYNLRMALGRQILAVPLRSLEQLGPSRLLAVQTDDVPTIAETVFIIPLLCINGTIAIGCLIYIAILSPQVALVVLAFILLGILGYQYPLRKARDQLKLVREQGDSILEHLRALTYGTKELKMHRERRHAFVNDLFSSAVDSFRRHSMAGLKLYSSAANWGQTLVFVVIGLVIFGLPFVRHMDRQMLTGYTLVLLYLMTPLQTFMNSLRILGRANVALNRAMLLGLQLEEQPTEEVSAIEAVDLNWRRLEFRSVAHTYEREGESSNFVLGPINITFNSGELVFITGGNGSGKTTFAKLLTGLYSPEEGEILLDGRRIVTSQQKEAYRQYFAAVFSDFYLFDRLLGLSGPELDDRAVSYLDRLELSHKIQIRQGKFSTADLSQGQKRRVALLTARMEDRPIYVFDEWAADQDPHFREVFYTHVLRELIGQGKTVFVITHDDRYFHVADRTIKLENGHIIADHRRREQSMSTPDTTLQPPHRVEVEPACKDPSPLPMSQPSPGHPLSARRASSLLLPLLLWSGLTFLAGLALQRLRPPVVPATASLQDFSVERALAHIRMIANVPHPIGSAANKTVRDYLIAELARLGMSPEVYPVVGVSSRPGFIVFGNTENILARLPGTANSQAVMLVAHYDSVYRSPGAADDGAGVAAILETVRALRAGPALKNDVDVLLTDGEEAGLLGADGFAFSRPEMKDVGMIMNFEARGNEGASLLFETSNHNHLLLEAVAESNVKPVGSSLFYALYKLLPNDTDFSVFRKRDVPGLNFAFGENLESYHSQLDTVDKLSAASLQQHGSYALNLTRQFGQMALTKFQHADGDNVFFNLIGGTFITYRQNWVLPGELLATFLLVLTLVLGARKSGCQWLGVAAGFLCSLAIAIVIPVALATLALLLTRMLAGRMIAGDSRANAFMVVGLVAAGCSIGSLLLAAARKRVSAQELFLGALMLALVMSWILALALPAGSYLVFWPVLLMIAGALGSALRKRTAQPHALGLMALPGTIVTCLLFAPIAYFLYVFLNLQWMTMAVVGVLVGLFFVLCMPVVNLAVPTDRWRPVALTFLLCTLACIGIGVKLSHPSAAHPRHDTILYSMNVDDRSAAWISLDPFLDDWTSQFFPNRQAQMLPMPSYLGGLQKPVLSAPAPLLNLDPPVAEIKNETDQDDLRRFSVDVKSHAATKALVLSFSKGVHLVSVRVGPRQVAPLGGSGPFSVGLLGMGARTTQVEITLKAPAGSYFWLTEQSVGLPPPLRARPDGIVPGEGSDLTLICRKYLL